jgi:hypothetical protein
MNFGRTCCMLICTLGVVGCIPLPATIEPTTLPDAIEDAGYNEQLTLQGGVEATWSVSAGDLPRGLYLAPGTGQFVGSALDPGRFDFTVVASGNAGLPIVASQEYILRVIEKLRLNKDIPAARVDEAYDYVLEITGGRTPYEVELAGLPGGMSFDGESYRITGTPLFENEELVLIITITDSGDPQQTFETTAVLQIKPTSVNITTTELPVSEIGTAYSVRLDAENGQTPFEWLPEAGVLPAGLRLDNESGFITGTPTNSATTQTFTISVTDSDDPASTDEQEYKLVVNVQIITDALDGGQVGTEYSEALGAVGGTPGYAWTLADGSNLPAGLELDGDTGVISGTPTTAGETTFTVIVTDGDDPATTDEQELTINIGA